MRPKPQGGVLLDGSFEQVKILVCNLVVRFVLYIVFHQFYSTPISASFRPFDVSVEDERINFFAYLFCTSKNRRFVVQKLGPMMNAVPFWSLVSNKADDGGYLSFPLVYYITQSLFHAHIISTKTATDLQE